MPKRTFSIISIISVRNLHLFIRMPPVHFVWGEIISIFPYKIYGFILYCSFIQYYTTLKKTMYGEQPNK